MLGFHPQIDIRHNLDGLAVSNKRLPHFTATEMLWYSSSGGWLVPRATGCGQKDPTGNRTKNLPSCGVMPQPTEPPPPK
jgi:hypothetical protein